MAEWLKALVLKVEPEHEKPNKSKVLPMSDIGFCFYMEGYDVRYVDARIAIKFIRKRMSTYACFETYLTSDLMDMHKALSVYERKSVDTLIASMFENDETEFRENCELHFTCLSRVQYHSANGQEIVPLIVEFEEARERQDRYEYLYHADSSVDQSPVSVNRPRADCRIGISLNP